MATSIEQKLPKDVAYYLYLQKEYAANTKLAEEWQILENFYNRKLWHQLTLKLESFVKHSDLQKDEKLIELYDNFLSTFESKINPVSLVKILAHVVNQFKDKRCAVEFLKKAESTVINNNEAVALCKVFEGQILLDELNAQDEVETIIEEVETILESSDDINTVYSKFFLLASRLYQLQGKHAEYYRSTLRYLGCIKLDSLTKADQEQHAFFLGLSALLGEDVYNLGELLAHPLLESMKNTSNSWLMVLLQAFNAGDVDELDRLKPQWSQIPNLADQELKLRQKISLLCLMEVTFNRPSSNRKLTFEKIAEETDLGIDEVEFLVMKALAQGLVRGFIDQVAMVVNLTWVQPRILSRLQLKNILLRLEQWSKDVDNMKKCMEKDVPKMFTP